MPFDLYQWFDSPEWNQFLNLSVYAMYVQLPVSASVGRYPLLASFFCCSASVCCVLSSCSSYRFSFSPLSAARFTSSMSAFSTVISFSAG